MDRTEEFNSIVSILFSHGSVRNAEEEDQNLASKKIEPSQFVSDAIHLLGIILQNETTLNKIQKL